METRTRLLIVLVVALLAGVANAAVIDTFNDSGFLIASTGPAAIDQDGVTGVVGGDRDSMVALTSGAGVVSGEMDNFNGTGTVDAYSLASGPASTGKWTLTYGDDTELNADLTDLGVNDKIKMEFLSADFGATVKITMTSDISGTPDVGSASKVVPAGPGTYTLNFADFTGSVDFSDVDLIVVEITGAVAGDYVVDFIETVPEPGTICLLIAGGIPLLLKRRRKA